MGILQQTSIFPDSAAYRRLVVAEEQPIGYIDD